jgi:hypothetical protein
LAEQDASYWLSAVRRIDRFLELGRIFGFVDVERTTSHVSEDGLTFVRRLTVVQFIGHLFDFGPAGCIAVSPRGSSARRSIAVSSVAIPDITVTDVAVPDVAVTDVTIPDVTVTDVAVTGCIAVTRCVGGAAAPRRHHQ